MKMKCHITFIIKGVTFPATNQKSIWMTKLKSRVGDSFQCSFLFTRSDTRLSRVTRNKKDLKKKKKHFKFDTACSPLACSCSDTVSTRTISWQSDSVWDDLLICSGGGFTWDTFDKTKLGDLNSIFLLLGLGFCWITTVFFFCFFFCFFSISGNFIFVGILF